MLCQPEKETTASGWRSYSFTTNTENWKDVWKKLGKTPQNSADFLTPCRRKKGKKKKNKNFLKNYKNFLDFWYRVAYNNSCVENTDAQLNKECAFSSVGRAPDS